ncbi:MAG: hypothetical protein Kow0029_27630 [Candidatus Rifleibacteriota bacterium]
MRNYYLKLRIILLLTGILISRVSFCAGNSGLKADFVRGRVCWKTSAGSPFELKPGALIESSDLTIFTYFDGQCFLKYNQTGEIRLKEDAVLVVKYPEKVEIRKGTIGLRNIEGELKVETPHVKLHLSNGIIVVKTNPVLTRVCVIKGTVKLLTIDESSSTIVRAGKEFAAAKNIYSKLYEFTDELRYTWYWVEAAKEPSLQLE